MRRSFLISAVVLFALLALMSPALAQTPVAEWTYMQYFAMDNNLESSLYGDLTEMQAVGSTDQVNIVAQVDRAPGFETRFGDWTDTRRFLLQHEPQPVLTQDEKIDDILILIYAQPNQDPDVLRQQLRDLKQKDPAAYQKLLTDIGLDPNNTALIDQIVRNNGLGMEFKTEPVQDLGEVDMGDPQSLVDFVTWAMATYPAKHYALTISSHGAGWPGNGPDDTNNKDLLQLPEIVQALGEIKAKTGVDQLDLIGFDACLMGQLEVYRALTPYTRYVLASEETIPGDGWEYTTPFTKLTQNPTMDAQELGTDIVDAYMAYYAGPGARTKVDLGLIDESKIPAVVDALGQFAANADQGTLDKLSELGAARISAQAFATSTSDAFGSGVSSSDIYSSVDLVSFMELLAAQPDIDPDLQAAAQAVDSAAQAAVVHGAADSYLPDAHGMAVYFPLNSKTALLPNLVIANLTPYATANPDMSSWDSFLSTLHTTIDTALTPDKLKINITQVLPGDSTASIYDPPVAIFDTTGQGIANIAFLATLNLDDGTRIMVDNSPLVFESVLPDGRTVDSFPSGESTGNDFAWNVETPMISDGTTQIPTALMINNASSGQALVNGTYVSGLSGAEVAASVIFDLGTQQAVSTYGISDDGAPYEIQTLHGDKFFPNWYSITSDGLTAIRSDSALVYGLNPFSFSYVPAASGSYTLTMLIQDLAGNISVSSANLNVDNTGLDPAWRGFKDVERGVNFLYPWGWSDPTQLANESGQVDQIEINDPNDTMQIYVAKRDDDIDTVVQDMVDLESAQTDAQVDTPQPFGDDPKAAQIITYQYIGDDGTRVGTVIVVRVDSNNATYSFDIDAPAANADQATAIIQKMVDSLTFFTPIQ